MAGKKKQKQVLDHDPLAWLEAEDDSKAGQAPLEHHPNQQGDNDESTLDDQAGYGFFDQEIEAVDEPAIIASDESAEAGYGFFDETSDLPSTSAMYRDDTRQVIHLGNELTIQNVAACKQLIDENLSIGVDIKLAAGHLHKIDTAGLQLLYSLNQSLQKTDQSIHWLASSSIIDEAAGQLGLNGLVGSVEEDAEFGFFDDATSATDAVNEHQDAGFGFF